MNYFLKYFSYLVFLTIFSYSADIHAQRSPDAPLGKLVVEGVNHATIKVRSDGYFSDTSAIKLSNLTSTGVGTEFIIQSINENGLEVRSESDVNSRSTDRILFLSPNGSVTMSSLEGTGSGNVFVNENGLLFRETPTTKYQSISAYAFTSGNSNFNVLNGQAYINTTAPFQQMIMPLQLPNGVTLSEITVNIYDNSSERLGFVLARLSIADNTYSSITNWLGPDISSDISAAYSRAVSTAIDNETYSYYLIAQPNINNSWDGTNLRVGSVRISYLQ